jgi:hypothetical protein
MDVHVLSLRARKARFKGSDFHSEQAFFLRRGALAQPGFVIPKGAFFACRGLGEPRDVARSLHHDNRASGTLLYQQRLTSAPANP